MNPETPVPPPERAEPTENTTTRDGNPNQNLALAPQENSNIVAISNALTPVTGTGLSNINWSPLRTFNDNAGTIVTTVISFAGHTITLTTVTGESSSYFVTHTTDGTGVVTTPIQSSHNGSTPPALPSNVYPTQFGCTPVGNVTHYCVPPPTCPMRSAVPSTPGFLPGCPFQNLFTPHVPAESPPPPPPSLYPPNPPPLPGNSIDSLASYSYNQQGLNYQPQTTPSNVQQNSGHSSFCPFAVNSSSEGMHGMQRQMYPSMSGSHPPQNTQRRCKRILRTLQTIGEIPAAIQRNPSPPLAQTSQRGNSSRIPRYTQPSAQPLRERQVASVATNTETPELATTSSQSPSKGKIKKPETKGTKELPRFIRVEVPGTANPDGTKGEPTVTILAMNARGSYTPLPSSSVSPGLLDGTEMDQPIRTAIIPDFHAISTTAGAAQAAAMLSMPGLAAISTTIRKSVLKKPETAKSPAAKPTTNTSTPAVDPSRTLNPKPTKKNSRTFTPSSSSHSNTTGSMTDGDGKTHPKSPGGKSKDKTKKKHKKLAMSSTKFDENSAEDLDPARLLAEFSLTSNDDVAGADRQPDIEPYDATERSIWTVTREDNLGEPLVTPFPRPPRRAIDQIRTSFMPVLQFQQDSSIGINTSYVSDSSFAANRGEPCPPLSSFPTSPQHIFDVPPVARPWLTPAMSDLWGSSGDGPDNVPRFGFPNIEADPFQSILSRDTTFPAAGSPSHLVADEENTSATIEQTTELPSEGRY